MATQDQKNSALLYKIETLKPHLSKSGRVLATYIVEHPDQVMGMSIAALSEVTGVSEPTIVRTCRRFGFNGYQSFKIALAQDIVNPLQFVHQEISNGDDMKGIMNKVLSGSIQAMQLTHDTANVEDIEAVAKGIMEAKNVYIFGVGGSTSIAMDFYHKLIRLGIHVIAYTDVHFQAIGAAYAKEGDVIFAISHSGSSRSVVDNARHARENGARVFSITSVGSSPLSKLADISLYTVSDETKYRVVSMASRLAALTITDSIYTYIAMQTEEIKTLKVEKALEDLKY